MASKRVFARMNEKPKFSTRKRNRCQLTGRARGVYRKFGISRIMLRELALNGVDALVFTAGVGENDARVRRLACQGLDYLGVAVADDRNEGPGKGLREINRAGARVKVLVIPTNEELEIANECYTLLHQGA